MLLLVLCYCYYRYSYVNVIVMLLLLLMLLLVIVFVILGVRIAYVLCSLRLFKLKRKGQTIKPHCKVTLKTN